MVPNAKQRLTDKNDAAESTQLQVRSKCLAMRHLCLLVGSMMWGTGYRKLLVLLFNSCLSSCRCDTNYDYFCSFRGVLVAAVCA